MNGHDASREAFTGKPFFLTPAWRHFHTEQAIRRGCLPQVPHTWVLPSRTEVHLFINLLFSSRAGFKLTEKSSSLKLLDFTVWSSPSERTVKYLSLLKLHSQVLDLPFSLMESPKVAGFQVFSSTGAKRKSSLGQVVNNLTTCFKFCQA